MTFNSLYWDFCFASSNKEKGGCNIMDIFQFPLLGFLLCILNDVWHNKKNYKKLSIPFIGIFALHLFALKFKIMATKHLFQFPLLGFLLCIPGGSWRLQKGGSRNFQFPLLGFLLCIAPSPNKREDRLSGTFNSLYWDFCFASN